jgi:peptidyl-prolyl cis-trans isomerase A (cyclophilin A)
MHIPYLHDDRMHPSRRVLLLAFSGFCLSCGSPNPKVTVSTPLGDIVVELYTSRAPITAGNFLRNIDSGRYAGASFYRTVTPDNQPHNKVKIEVIQGGIGDRESEAPRMIHETTSRTGIHHTNGVISMARLEPGTASTEFFICVGDQPELDYGGHRNPDLQGFAAFGRVVSGMDVVRSIQHQPADGQALKPEIPIRSITRVP